MCEEPGTSREHVPPKCLFPEQKDIKDKNFRKNLITVPSCDLHNMSKSKDDEYLMQVIVGSIKSNNYGIQHYITKVHRSYKRINFDLNRYSRIIKKLRPKAMMEK